MAALHADLLLTLRNYRLYVDLARREWRAGAPGVRKGGEYMTRLVKVNCTTQQTLRDFAPTRLCVASPGPTQRLRCAAEGSPPRGSHSFFRGLLARAMRRVNLPRTKQARPSKTSSCAPAETYLAC